jgi:DNA-binding transcriptional MerR regulator
VSAAPESQGNARGGKSAEAFRTISEVADELDVAQHVLRFWESRFPQVKPMKRGGGRRYYRPEDVHLLRGIQQLLYRDGFTIKGAQKLMREHGARSLIDAVRLGRGLEAWRQGEGAPTPPAVVAAPPLTLDPARRRKLEAVAVELRALATLLRRGA